MFNVIIQSWDYDISTTIQCTACRTVVLIPGIKVQVVKYEHKNVQNANKTQLSINEILYIPLT